MRAILVAAAVLAGAGAAEAADAVEVARVTVVERSPCADAAVQSRVARRFAQKEREYWDSTLKLEAFWDTRELGYRPWGEAFIPRRFCSARTRTSDGYERVVFYSIIKGAGFAGSGPGVEFCVTGLDRNLAYAPACKMAQP